MRIIAVPDMHLPWADWDAVSLIYAHIESKKTDLVIQLGDLYDLYSHSRFNRSQDVCTPREEILEARQGAENFWKNVRKVSNGARCVQISGNHDARIHKRIDEKYPELASLVDISHLWKFDGVETLHDDRAWFEYEGIIFLHGYLTKLGDHCKHFMRPVVHGHTHRGGTFFQHTQTLNHLKQPVIWELDCGYLADPNSIPLQYGPTKNMAWAQGFGEIDENGPRFIPIPK